LHVHNNTYIIQVSTKLKFVHRKLKEENHRQPPVKRTTKSKKTQNSLKKIMKYKVNVFD